MIFLVQYGFLLSYSAPLMSLSILHLCCCGALVNRLLLIFLHRPMDTSLRTFVEKCVDLLFYLLTNFDE